uniref:hypothetical protein n=1 Tax=Bifidobacterium magnum TaxID=1692 RepID=UPI00195544DA
GSSPPMWGAHLEIPIIPAFYVRRFPILIHFHLTHSFSLSNESDYILEINSFPWRSLIKKLQIQQSPMLSFHMCPNNKKVTTRAGRHLPL